MSKCKKKQRKPMERGIAEAKTRANKIRKFTRIVKNNPNDHCARNTLDQLLYDSGRRV